MVRLIGSGAPVPDATVVLTAADGRHGGQVRTGADGAFGFDGLEPGTYELSASARRQVSEPVEVPTGRVDPSL